MLSNVELRNRIEGAAMYLERATLLAGDMLDEYFGNNKVANDPTLMAFEFNRYRIINDIVIDLIIDARKALKGEE
jgi:hypothetical protein